MEVNSTTFALGLMIAAAFALLVGQFWEVCASEKLAYYARALACALSSGGTFLFVDIAQKCPEATFPPWLRDRVSFLSSAGWVMFGGAIFCLAMAAVFHRSRGLFE